MEAFIEKIDESVALLISMGHRDAWDYGYSFFKTSLKMLEVVAQQQTACVIEGVGIGIGLVLSGKLKDFLEKKHAHSSSDPT